MKLNLSAPAADDDEVHELDADSDIVMADDDDVDIVSSAEADEADGEEKTLAVDPDNYGIVAESANARDTSEQHVLPDDSIPNTPFEGEKFDPETQAAFAALEAGSPENVPPSGDMVDLRNLWSDDDLPPNLAWEKPPGEANGAVAAPSAPSSEAVPEVTGLDPDVYRTGETLGPEPLVSDALLASALAHNASTNEHDVPPAPDEIAFEDVSTEASGRVISENFGAPAVDEGRVREAEARNAELEARIHSLENERQTLRKEIEEARERFTQSATFSKEREFLGLRENHQQEREGHPRSARRARRQRAADARPQGQDPRARPGAARSRGEHDRVRAEPGRRQ